MKKYDLEDRLAYCLFACRFGVFMVFLAWSYIKLIRPEHGVHIMETFYYAPGLPESLIVLFAVFELTLCILLLLGFYKKWVRGFFLLLSILAVFLPEVLLGYFNAIAVRAHPTILYFTGFCLLACCIAIYTLRDYDRLFSFSKQDRLSSNG